MFDQAIPGNLRRNLEAIGRGAAFSQFYLAGGTACALQLGHRISYDLDFFTAEPFDTKRLAGILANFGVFNIDKLTEDTILGNLNDYRVSFFWYRYLLLKPAKNYLGVKLADLSDIGCMKIDAIQSRGKKRDFFDLWAIMKKGGVDLSELLSSFDKKFSGISFNRIHILKSLTYFEDAEADPLPELLEKISWEKVKEFFIAETKNRVWSS